MTISVAFKAWLATPSRKSALIARFTLKDSTVKAFTTHDQPITVSAVTYIPAYNRSDVAGASDLSVDNLTYEGILRSTEITEEDIRIGKWDYAQFTIAEVNWGDLTMGTRIVRVGRLGEVSVERVTFAAQLNGLTQAYATTIGELTQAACRHDLFDAGCTINPAGSSPGSPSINYTVTGSIDGVGDDGVTLYDAARTEPGPAGGIAITGITQADPGVVTLASTPDPVFTEGELVTISGVGGMVEVNSQTVVHSPSGATFNLSVDTSGFNAYTSGGTVTPAGADAGWFKYGKISFTSGANFNAGCPDMEISDYVPGQLRLALPMPYAVQIGDTYSLTAGCDKWLPTCRDKFGNILNHDGEHYMTGNDRLLNIGKQH